MSASRSAGRRSSIGATFAIERGERVCLLGRNGAGKSTVMKLLDGTIAPDTGEIVRQTGVTVARLEQEIPGDVDGTTYDVVAAGLGAAGRCSRSITRPAIASPSSTSDAALRELDRLHHALDSADAWQLQTRVETVLSHLGLDADMPFAAASGGRKRQTLLARALVREPDVLLLDEPTNHLDVDAIEWMESFLIDRGTTLVFVTHDRAFLRRVATRIVELDRGRLRRLGRRLRHVSRAQGSGIRRRGARVVGVRQEAGEGGSLDSDRHPGAAHTQRRSRARARGVAPRARCATRAHGSRSASGAGSRAIGPARRRGARRELRAWRAHDHSRLQHDDHAR